MTAPPGIPTTPTVRTDTRDTVVSFRDMEWTLAGGAVCDAPNHKTRWVRNRHGLAGPLLQRPR